jgi:hypothetical protein
MTDTIAFDDTTARFSLPNIFQAQAQKEFYINEAHALIDILLHPSVEGIQATPPSSPNEGDCWIVAVGGTGGWIGKDGAIASRQNGAWTFITPKEGLSAFNKASGQILRYHAAWNYPTNLSAPSGGTNIDSEARNSIQQVITVLRQAGILPA